MILEFSLLLSSVDEVVKHYMAYSCTDELFKTYVIKKEKFIVSIDTWDGYTRNMFISNSAFMRMVRIYHKKIRPFPTKMGYNANA